MKNSRFREMFNSLTHSDYKKFEEMVNSPFFNKNKRVNTLWEYLKCNGDNDEVFTKENISQVIFGNNKFADSNFRMVISSFVRLVGEYLLQKEYQQNKMETKIRQLEIFQNKNLTKSFSKYLNEIEYQLDKEKTKDSTYYYRKYFIECLKINSGKGGDKTAARGYYNNLIRLKK